ncbi:MAG: hypothetical protein RL211_1989 [Pseudomonadota bacterium]|jgi:hypothetical protein
MNITLKRSLFTVTLAVLTHAAGATNVGVSVRIGEPGFYGHIEIGNMPQPRVIYPAPVIIQPAPVGVVTAPAYMRVPPGHEKNWRKHCIKYNACAQPVYFVQQGWYNNVYAPIYRQEHHMHEDDDHGHGMKKKKRHDNKH